MSQLDVLVQQAVGALKANKREEARRILEHVVEQDERHEQAWLWLSGCVDTVDEQIICLQNVLTVNPSNQKARKGLDALQKQKGGPKPGGGTPTSVEWASGATPALGSGKNVQLPTDEEYDSWLDGLRLGGSGDGGVFTGGFNAAPGPFSATPDPYGAAPDPYAMPAESSNSAAPDYDVYNYDAYSYNYDTNQGGAASGTGYDAYGSGTDVDYGDNAYNNNSYDNNAYGNSAPTYDAPAYEAPKTSAPNPFDTYDLSGFNTFGSSGQAPAGPPAAPGYQDAQAGFDAGYGEATSTSAESGGSDPYGTSSGNYDLNSGYNTYETPAPAAPTPRARFGAPAASAPQSDTFNFEEEPYDPNYDPTQALPAGVAMSAPSAGADLRFKVIPEEIQLGSSGGVNVGAMLPVLGLAALNMVSIILLIINLTGS